jgi:hypothetical protein
MARCPPNPSAACLHQYRAARRAISGVYSQAIGQSPESWPIDWEGYFRSCSRRPPREAGGVRRWGWRRRQRRWQKQRQLGSGGGGTADVGVLLRSCTFTATCRKLRPSARTHPCAIAAERYFDAMRDAMLSPRADLDASIVPRIEGTAVVSKTKELNCGTAAEPSGDASCRARMLAVTRWRQPSPTFTRSVGLDKIELPQAVLGPSGSSRD